MTSSSTSKPSTSTDVLTLSVSEDAYEGDAEFIVLVDGDQVGGVQTATASHAAGQWQTVTLTGSFPTDASAVAVQFLNDAWGGSAATDRNLYVGSLTFDGATYAGNTATSDRGLTSGTAAALHTNGAATFRVASHQTLTLSVSEDAYQGDAQFVVLVDGKQVGGIQTATASHAAGQWQDVSVTGSFTANPSDIAVQFLNDAWGGSAATDRNLYVGSLTFDGTTYAGATAVNTAGGFTSGTAAALNTNGAATFDIAPDRTLTVSVAEDAYQGDAQFVVLVDGKQVGGVQTATASHATGQWQDVSVTGAFSADPSEVAVQFLNDAWGGSSATDRNLYVGALTVAGRTYAGDTATSDRGLTSGTAAALHTNGAATFDLGTEAGSAGPGVSFGANQYASAGKVDAFDSDQSWSVESKVRVDAAPPGPSYGLPSGGADLIFGNTNGEPYTGYEAWVDYTGHVRVRIMSDFVSGQYIDVQGSSDIVDGKLHSIGVSYDGSSTAAGVKIYVDGAQDPTKTISDTLKGSTVSDGPLILGNQLNGWQNQFQLRGDMEDFVLSNVVRPASYFEAARSATPAVDASTQLAYTFQEGSGVTVADHSAYHHDATLSSSTLWTV